MKKGYLFVAGLDEAGRGALAGPVVSAAVCLPAHFLESIPLALDKVEDSKRLSSRQRLEIFEAVECSPDICYSLGIVSEKVIDRVNIFQATKQAMVQALQNLPCSPDFLIIDGNFTLPLKLQQRSIVGADRKVFSVALASILAKVARDKLMEEYHSSYPDYAFDRHKGYGTKDHYRAIASCGCCPIHRQSFRIKGAWQKG